jgi:hypothetical protein
MLFAYHKAVGFPCQNAMHRESSIHEPKIGGPDIIVEIDETKLGKRQYNKGHHVGGVWCVCGIEKTESKKCFVLPVENRNAYIMHAIIKKYVEPGTIIYTDCLKAYINQVMSLVSIILL